MWRLTSRFFLGILAAAICTNAAAVYAFHDVDADRIGERNLAYRELMLEFLAFSLVVTALFLVLTWGQNGGVSLTKSPLNTKLGFVLGNRSNRDPIPSRVHR